ncbi:MAG: M56 family metallopeptidase [Acidobacteriia bacterium]|nr:M56 family metallopeptidase [Terriglobia bacterium]
MNADFFLISAVIDFVLLNVVFSTLALGVERVLQTRVRSRWSARRWSRWLFVLAAAPFVLASVVILALQIPVQLWYEPHEPVEYVSIKIFLIGMWGLIGAGVAGLRQFASWWMASRFQDRALAVSQPWCAENTGTKLPIYRIRHELPLCCLFGIRRPKLFLADQLFERLSSSELRAALAHEESHWRHHDNLKSACLNALKNFFFFIPTYRRLVDRWREGVELACDEEAAERTQAPLELASALVKIARLTPHRVPSPRLLMAGLGLVDFNSSWRLQERISRLLLLAEGFYWGDPPFHISLFSVAATAGAISALSFLAIQHHFFFWFHHGIEVLEHFFM